MMKSNGLNQLNKKLEQHAPFELHDKDGLFARFDYDINLNRYQSDYGYLTLQGVYEISKDETDDRFVVWL